MEDSFNKEIINTSFLIFNHQFLCYIHWIEMRLVLKKKKKKKKKKKVLILIYSRYGRNLKVKIKSDFTLDYTLSVLFLKAL
jgi:hypothetical protein